jgi:DNA-directed RNA polymerase
MFQTFTGLEYLKIDIANNYGLDKLTWDERLQWFDQNYSNLANLISSAKEPALFYAGLKAYFDALKGEPIGYMISLDATASGLQLLAALTGDRSAAQLCNVVDTGRREDAYTIVYEEMVHRIGDTSKISRDHAKEAVRA